jgi:hypothetical protein
MDMTAPFPFDVLDIEDNLKVRDHEVGKDLKENEIMDINGSFV